MCCVVASLKILNTVRHYTHVKFLNYKVHNDYILTRLWLFRIQLIGLRRKRAQTEECTISILTCF